MRWVEPIAHRVVLWQSPAMDIIQRAHEQLSEPAWQVRRKVCCPEVEQALDRNDLDCCALLMRALRSGDGHLSEWGIAQASKLFDVEFSSSTEAIAHIEAWEHGRVDLDALLRDRDELALVQALAYAIWDQVNTELRS